MVRKSLGRGRVESFRSVDPVKNVERYPNERRGVVPHSIRDREERTRDVDPRALGATPEFRLPYVVLTGKKIWNFGSVGGMGASASTNVNANTTVDVDTDVSVNVNISPNSIDTSTHATYNLSATEDVTHSATATADTTATATTSVTLAAGGVESTTIPVIGARVASADAVIVSLSSLSATDMSRVMLHGAVTADDVVTVTLRNVFTGAVDIASGLLRATVIRFTG